MFPSRNGNSPSDSFHDTVLQRGTAPLRTYLCEDRNRVRITLRVCIFLCCVRQSWWLSLPLLQRVHLSGAPSVHSRHVWWQRWHCPSLSYFPGSQWITHVPLSKSLQKNKNWNLSPHSAHLVSLWLRLWCCEKQVICSHFTWCAGSWCSLYSQVQCTLSKLRNTVHIFQLCLNTPLTTKNTDNT